MSNSKLFYFFFLFLTNLSSSSSSVSSIIKCSDEQRDALLLFKKDLSFVDQSSDYVFYSRTYNSRDTNCRHFRSYQNRMITWNTSIDCCLWYGVTCSHLTGDVIEIDLRCGMLKGKSKLDILFSSLPNLEVLDLSYNSISVVTNNATNYVNPDFRVFSLANCKLTVFPKFLHAMKNLEVLDLSHNYIQGPFPQVICNMSNLSYLDMSSNIFGGVIPQCLGNLTSSRSLTVISLGMNEFRGKNPEFLHAMKNLEVLDLSHNYIQGPFPQVICNMSNLLYLDMSSNIFGGVIPQCLGHLTSSGSLTVINLGMNEFQGTIPHVFPNCGLVGLLLNSNQLKGEVPRSLFNCQSLKALDLRNNQLNGRFPQWLGDLPNLQLLALGSNYLYGTIETSFTMDFPFRSVEIFDISDNRFIGHVPGKYFESFHVITDVDRKPKTKIWNTSLLDYSFILDDYRNPSFHVEYTIVDLSGNMFDGEIPDVVDKFNSLTVFNLSHNNLSGKIPPALGNLMELEVLDLSWNQLTGEIPQSLINMTCLEFMNLSQNHLVGRIPVGKQFNTFEEYSYGGNPGLCGVPLPRDCQDITPLQLQHDEDGSEFVWKMVMLGYACGTLVGLLMGFRMLSTGKPKWFNAIVDALERMIPTRQKNKRRRYTYIGK